MVPGVHAQGEKIMQSICVVCVYVGVQVTVTRTASKGETSRATVNKTKTE